MDMAANSDTGSFDLHRLPRELRDHIHDFILLGQPETPVTKDEMHRVSFKHAMTSRLALVSRQFRQECKEREARLCVLVLGGDWNWYHRRHFSKLPALANIAVALDVRMQIHSPKHDAVCLAGRFCQISFGLGLHRRSAQTMTACLGHIRRVDLHLYIAHSTHQDSDLRCLLTHQARLTNLAGVSSLDVYQSPRACEDASIVPDGEIVASWNSETKQLERTTTPSDRPKATHE
ncbi:hypothetical protein LTR53_007723 [Teratosphaeriaceae sp. CCFEE 6253]|nr:hypothetical protein LTR53_007723 [Teratosphaeriaceae sp. CCFEE 6253]